MEPATEIPSELYHATYDIHLESILGNGLGGVGLRKNFEISRTGVVYLADDADAARDYALNAQFGCEGEVVILAIAASALDASRLSEDINDEGEYGGVSYAYRGVIPASAVSGYDFALGNGPGLG